MYQNKDCIFIKNGLYPGDYKMTAEEIAAKELEINKKEAELLLKEKELLERESHKDDSGVDALVKAKLDEAIKDIKTKLDKAYSNRDEALKKVAEFEEKEREAQLQRLKDEGKHKEAFELQLAEEKAKNEVLTKRNVELTRDVEVKGVLGGYTFRNDKSFNLAFKEIASDLIKDSKEQWVHSSGVSIKEYIKAFSEDPENSFLFKQQASSGSGGSGGSGNTGGSSDKKKSLFDMSQADVIKMAEEGKLKKNKG